MSRMALETAIRLSAEVKGGANITKVQRSIQDLAKSSQITAREMNTLRSATSQLARANDSTIAGLRNSVAAFRGLQEQAKIGTREFARYGSEIQRLEAKLRGLDGTAKSLRGAAASAAGTLAMGGGPMGALGAVGGSLAASGGAAGLLAAGGITLAGGAGVLASRVGVEAETAEVRLRALTDQFGEYNAAQESAARIAKTLRISQIEASDGFAKLYASLRPTGITLNEIEDAFTGFTAAARVAGATAEESSSALIQLKQALGSGVLQGDELRSIREQAPLVGQAIAKEMGVTIGELKKLGEEGKVTAEVVIRALAKLKGEKLGQLQQQFSTSAQAMKDLQVATENFGVAVSRAFGPLAIGTIRTFTAAINLVASGFQSYNNARNDEILRGKAVERAKKITGTSNQWDPRFRAAFDSELAKLKSGQADSATRSAQQQERAAAAMERQSAAARAAAARAASSGGGGAGSQQSRQLSAEDRITAKPFGREIIAAAKANSLDPALYAALVGQESGFNQRARSRSGAIGLAQLMPGTAKELGVNPYNPMENLMGGAKYLRQQMDRFGLEGGLRAYNQGPGAQQRNPGGNSRESREYPGKVLARYKQLSGKDEDIAGLTAAGIQAQTQQAETMKRQRESLLLDGMMADKRADYVQTQRQINDLMLSQNAASESGNALLALQIEARRVTLESGLEQIKLQDEYNRKLTESAANQDLQNKGLRDAVIQAEFNASAVEREESSRIRLAEIDQRIATQQKQNAIELIDLERERAQALQESLSYMQELSTRDSASAGFQQGLQGYVDSVGNLRDAVGQLTTNTIGGLENSLTQLATTGSLNFREFALSVIADTQQMILRQFVLKTIMSAIGGLGGSGIAKSFELPGTGFMPTNGFAWPSMEGGGYTGSGSRSGGLDGKGGFMAMLHPQESVIDHTWIAPSLRRGGDGTSYPSIPGAPAGADGALADAAGNLTGDGTSYPAIPGGGSSDGAAMQGQPGLNTSSRFERTDVALTRMVEAAKQDAATQAAITVAASSGGPVRVQLETTRINSVDYVTLEQAQGIANAAASRSTARERRALQANPAARRGVGI